MPRRSRPHTAGRTAGPRRSRSRPGACAPAAAPRTAATPRSGCRPAAGEHVLLAGGVVEEVQVRICQPGQTLHIGGAQPPDLVHRAGPGVRQPELDRHLRDQRAGTGHPDRDRAALPPAIGHRELPSGGARGHEPVPAGGQRAVQIGQQLLSPIGPADRGGDHLQVVAPPVQVAAGVAALGDQYRAHTPPAGGGDLAGTQPHRGSIHHRGPVVRQPQVLSGHPGGPVAAPLDHVS